MPYAPQTYDSLMTRVAVCSHGMNCTQCCWEWTGARDRYGYGKAYYRGTQVSPHRILYKLKFKYRLTRERYILHTCDNRLCCNWHHCFIGTAADNMQDKAEKGRSTQGTKSSQAKLTENSVRELRALYKTGEYTQKALASRFGISTSVAHRILTHQDWTHVK